MVPTIIAPIPAFIASAWKCIRLKLATSYPPEGNETSIPTAKVISIAAAPQKTKPSNPRTIGMTSSIRKAAIPISAITARCKPPSCVSPPQSIKPHPMPEHETPKGQRTPRDSDLQPILDRIWSGMSLNSACKELGINTPAASQWLHADPARDTSYTRAREGRALVLQEEVLLLSKAASMGKKIEGSKIDAAALRVHLDAVKWAIGRMAPNTTPPEKHQIDVRYPDLTTEEIKARAMAKARRLLGDGDSSD